MRRNAATDAADPYSPEVLLQAAQVRIAAVDHPPQSRSGDQHGLRTRACPRHPDQRLRRQVVKIAGKRLEFRDDAKDVGMSDRPPDLQRPAWAADLAQMSMRLGQSVDSLTALSQPPAKRERPRIRHTTV